MYKLSPGGGNLHSILDDLNVHRISPTYLDDKMYSEGSAEQKEAEQECLKLICEMPLADIYRLLDLYHGIDLSHFYKNEP